MNHQVSSCVGLLLLIAGASPAVPIPSQVEDLKALIESGSDDALESPLPSMAVGAGPAALPALRHYLDLPEADTRRLLAATAIAYIGGEDAVDMLRAHLSPSDDAGNRSLLAFAFASTGRREERALLIRWLEGEHFGSDWAPIVEAALSLGVLRESGALGELTRTGEEADSIAGDAARQATRWIKNGPRSVSAPGADLHPAVVAVLRNGIPSTDRSDAFYDPDRKACWFQSRAGWTLSTRACSLDLPSLRLEVHVSPDGLRALVSVGLTFGMLDGVGYDYVVRRTGKTWKVQGLMFTWIS